MSNNKFEGYTMSAAQRARKDRSGAAAAKVIRGGAVDAKEAEAARPKARYYPGTGSHFKNPTEFLAGPSEPGKVRPSIRRFGNAEKDTVGIMLTDEFMMSGGVPPEGGNNGKKGKNGKGGAPAAEGNKSRAAGFSSGPAFSTRADTSNQRQVNTGPKSNLGNHCEVKTEEPPFHTGTRMIHQPGPMDAPYYEDQDPKAPRDEPRCTGTRHFKEKRPSFFLGDQPMTDVGKNREAMFGKPLQSYRTGRANESLDVINLGIYTPEQLQEPPANRDHKWGPRKWTAPDMPPRKPPAMRPIKTYAKDEHDVLGNGRFGKAEPEKPHGVAKGGCRPPKDTANLFRSEYGRVVYRTASKNTKKIQPAADAPAGKKLITMRNTLRYYDPNVDKASDFAPAPVRAKAARSNVESDPAASTPAHGRRHYKQSTQPSIVDLSHA